jgi:DNA-binding SARP family transcriptional activator
MEFRILGPLEVHDERGAISLGGSKPRALLAVLLLHRNEPVSVDRLAVALYGEDAPSRAVKTVHVHLSRLRKALGDVTVLTTTAAGYSLRVRQDELDAERFVRLADLGVAALDDGHPERAGDTLREALALWRGPALADLAFEQFTHDAIARLHEQRLTALEARIEADLALGHHASVLDEIRALVAAEPTRERLAEHLMVALYRSGRQAEALDVYRGARRALVAELGLEPGPQLRRLQEAILRHDAALETPVPPLPGELVLDGPSPSTTRSTELAWLLERLERARNGEGTIVSAIGADRAARRRLVAALAAEAHRLQASVLYATGLPPSEAALSTLHRARAATRPTLLVVDDADDAAVAVVTGLSALQNVVSSLPVLVVTSGTAAMEALEGAHLLRLDTPAASHSPPASLHRFPLSRVAPRVSEGAFVGREECLRQMRSRWAESRETRLNFVVLVGQAGMGKTRLARQFAEFVHHDAGAALWGSADVDALLPYQPFAEALTHLVEHAGPGFVAEVEPELATLSMLFPSLRQYTTATPATIDQDTLRYQVFEAVVAVFTRASKRWPILLVLDDLHWADKPTLLLLRHVLRHAASARMLVVGTFRDVEVSSDHPLAELLVDLRRERRYDRLQLSGLDGQATHELVRDRLGIDITPGFVVRLQEQTDGNAFFIEETVRALEDSGLAQGAPVDESALDRLGVPEGIAEVIVRRTRSLSSLASELVTVASVAGPVFRVEIVEQLVDANPDAVVSAFEDCMAAGLVIEIADRPEVLTFSHALVREVLYRQLAGSRRIRLHHRVGEALERLGKREPVNPAELAHHFALASHLAGAEPARRYAIAAGRRAAELFAYEEAAEHFRRALALFGEDSDEADRCEVLLALGRVEWHAGDDNARVTFLEAAESAERRGAADQLSRAALGLGERYFEVTYLGARYRDLLEKAESALPRADSPRRSLLLSRLAVNLAFPDEARVAHGLAAEAVAIAQRLGDEKLLGAVLLAQHVTLLDIRHVEERLTISDALSSLAGGHAELAAEHHHWRMYDLLEVGEIDAARQEHAKLETLASRLGQPLLRSLALGARGLFLELDGDLEAAEDAAELSLREARKAHTQDAVSSWASQIFALRHRQGRLAELTSVVERLAGSGGRQLGWLSALGVVCLETGDTQRARRIYHEEMDCGPERLPRGMFWLTRIALLSELSARLGDRAGARELYGQLAPHAGRNVVVAYCSFYGPVDGYLALLADTFGDRDAATRHCRAALERARTFDAPLLVRDLERRHDALPWAHHGQGIAHVRSP